MVKNYFFQRKGKPIFNSKFTKNLDGAQFDATNKSTMWDINLTIAENPNSSANALQKIVDSDETDYNVLGTILKNPNVSPDTLAQIGDKFPSLQHNVIVHKSTPLWYVEKFCEPALTWLDNHGFFDEPSIITELAFTNPSLSEKFLWKAINVKEYLPASYAIANPNITEEMIETIWGRINDPNYLSTSEKRKKLVANTNMTVFDTGARKQRKTHEIRRLLFAISKQKNTPNDILFAIVEQNFTAFDITTLSTQNTTKTQALKNLRNKGVFGDWPDEWVEARYGVPLE